MHLPDGCGQLHSCTSAQGWAGLLACAHMHDHARALPYTRTQVSLWSLSALLDPAAALHARNQQQQERLADGGERGSLAASPLRPIATTVMPLGDIQFSLRFSPNNPQVGWAEGRGWGTRSRPQHRLAATWASPGILDNQRLWPQLPCRQLTRCAALSSAGVVRLPCSDTPRAGVPAP